MLIKNKFILFFLMFLLTSKLFANSIPILMSLEFAEKACENWNKNETLTTEMTNWMENDLGRGHKLILMKRKDCRNDPYIQLTIQREQETGLTICTYGGFAHLIPNKKADYKISAKTKVWNKIMNANEIDEIYSYILTGRIRISGPLREIHDNIDQFSAAFFTLGEIEYTDSTCLIE